MDVDSQFRRELPVLLARVTHTQQNYLLFSRQNLKGLVVALALERLF
jgi:hypothetical protein